MVSSSGLCIYILHSGGMAAPCAQMVFVPTDIVAQHMMVRVLSFACSFVLASSLSFSPPHFFLLYYWSMKSGIYLYWNRVINCHLSLFLFLSLSLSSHCLSLPLFISLYHFISLSLSPSLSLSFPIHYTTCYVVVFFRCTTIREILPVRTKWALCTRRSWWVSLYLIA